MFPSPTVQQRNEELARQINAEALANPSSQYAGKFVGIANGQVVAIGDNLDKVMQTLIQAEPDPAKGFFLEAGVDYDEIQEIWSIE